MTAAYLAPLERPELDELIRTAEHAECKAMILFRMLPLDQPDSSARLAAACGVVQDCLALKADCYEMNYLWLAAEMDRVLDLGDPPEYQPDEDSQ